MSEVGRNGRDNKTTSAHWALARVAGRGALGRPTNNMEIPTAKYGKTNARAFGRPTINMEIPTAKYGKTTKKMENIHVRMRVKIQRV